MRTSSGGFAELRLAPPDPRVGELDDLQHVDHVHGRRERDDADRAGAHSRPEMPAPVPVERDEARSERRAREGQAPAPDVDGGAALREPAPDEAVVEVLAVRDVDRPAVFEAPGDDEARV